MFLILPVLVVCLLAAQQQAIVASFSAPQRSRSTKILIDDVASIDRRKSPALWRLLDFEDSQETSRTMVHEQQQQQQQQLDVDDTARSYLYFPKKPEIMSPAGGWPQLRAAVANGADAVYLGLTAFSARARAANFDHDDLIQAVAYCHKYQVQVYVALNTLVFDHELDEVSELVQRCVAANVDAVIVQDLGLCRLIQQICPTLPIHSSTQQSITDADGVQFCHDQHGATRVVLSRELSLAEIRHVTKRIQTTISTAQTTQQQQQQQHPVVEIETFVHGALCVSYSGQCFSSEAWGGRSANRGQCAQACRLPYGLIQNGILRDTQDMKYLLSPQDLSGIEQVPDLIKAGVACLKIEGRLKDAQYVAATTRAYRNAVDEAWQELTGEGAVEKDFSECHVSSLELTQLFSRGQDETHLGLTPGFFDGTHHQRLVRGRSPRHRGVHVGRVLKGSSPRSGIAIQVDAQWVNDDSILKLGDGIVIDRGLAEEEELGGPVFSIENMGRGVFQLDLSRGAIKKWKAHDGKRRPDQPSLVPVGGHVWKTHDAVVERKFRRMSEAEPPKLLVQVKVVGSIGSPLQVIITNGIQTVVGETDDVLQQAEGSGMDAGKVQKAIGTKPFEGEWAIAEGIDLSGLDQAAWCPVSWIKEARRRAVHSWEQVHATLTEQQKEANLEMKSAPFLQGEPSRLLQRSVARLATHVTETPTETSLSVLCRNLDQVDAICKLIESGDDSGKVDEIVIDFLEVDGMREAMNRIRATEKRINAVVASPRILKPEEGGIWKSLLSLEPDALLIRSTGLLHRMRTLGNTTVNVGTATEEHWVAVPILLGDFSLNAANALTVSELLSAGLERVTASYDLNANSIAQMGEFLGPSLSSKLEVVVHCKMPIFHTEHCVFARFLTKGNSFLDCGHVCTRNTIHLRDERGLDNLVLADMGCRNTVFSAQAQSGVHSLKQWQAAGIRRFRIELVDEGPEDSVEVVRAYSDCAAGFIKASVVWDLLQDIRDSNGRSAGVSLGSFRNNQERRAGEIAS